ncbi:hypothetical protein Tco_0183968 [Tanacetum coccineum]
MNVITAQLGDTMVLPPQQRKFLTLVSIGQQFSRKLLVSFKTVMLANVLVASHKEMRLRIMQKSQRKRIKPTIHGHGNGKSAQEPGISSKVNSSRNPYVIPDVKGNDTLAIPCILIGGINVAGNGRLRSKWYEDSYGSKADKYGRRNSLGSRRPPHITIHKGEAHTV